MHCVFRTIIFLHYEIVGVFCIWYLLESWLLERFQYKSYHALFSCMLIISYAVKNLVGKHAITKYAFCVCGFII